jgi:hypothetical protein
MPWPMSNQMFQDEIECPTVSYIPCVPNDFNRLAHDAGRLQGEAIACRAGPY